MTGRRGFTLIEIVIVMAIIAISMSLVGPRIGAGFSGLYLNQSAQTVKRMLKLARLQAERTERHQYVVLNRKTRSVVLVGSDLEVQRQETLPSGIDIVLESDSDTASVLVTPAGLLRGPSIRLRGRAGEIEVALQ